VTSRLGLTLLFPCKKKNKLNLSLVFWKRISNCQTNQRCRREGETNTNCTISTWRDAESWLVSSWPVSLFSLDPFSPFSFLSVATATATVPPFYIFFFWCCLGLRWIDELHNLLLPDAKVPYEDIRYEMTTEWPQHKASKCVHNADIHFGEEALTF
jgi:hypothetical protein